MARTKSPKSHSRPFRLWDYYNRRPYPHRYYSGLINAHNGAMKQCHWTEVDVTVVLYHDPTAMPLGYYMRKPTVNGEQKVVWEVVSKELARKLAKDFRLVLDAEEWKNQ